MAAWQEWFGDHIYRAILVTATLEGMGLPVPCELLFLPGVHLARQGQVSLVAMALLATFGNVAGGLLGFAIAYWGGAGFLHAVSRLLGIRPEAMRRMESFFARYGQATVFLSRFVGLIRAATIYAAGAARMSPSRFLLYLSAAALIWNSAWVWVIDRFEGEAVRLLEGHGMGNFLAWLAGLGATLLLGNRLLGWYRRRRPTPP
ncbi:MAG: DedA family protein [Bacillota bacterium]